MGQRSRAGNCVGAEDTGVRVSAQAARNHQPDKLLQYQHHELACCSAFSTRSRHDVTIERCDLRPTGLADARRGATHSMCLSRKRLRWQLRLRRRRVTTRGLPQRHIEGRDRHVALAWKHDVQVGVHRPGQSPTCGRVDTGPGASCARAAECLAEPERLRLRLSPFRYGGRFLRSRLRQIRRAQARIRPWCIRELHHRELEDRDRAVVFPSLEEVHGRAVE